MRVLTFSDPPVAPSISSMTTRTGFELPTLEPLSKAGRMRRSTTSADRASLIYVRTHKLYGVVDTNLALTSKASYPACAATICARVVFPSPGGPDNSNNCGSESELRGAQ